MILQLSVFLLSLLLFAAWGLPASAALRGKMPTMLLSTPAFGVGALAVITTLLYISGLSIADIAVTVAVLAVVFVILFRKTVYFILSAAYRSPLACTIFAASAAIVCSPILTGRPEFTVFQGNQWDHLNYLTVSAVFSQMGFQQVCGATDADFLANPLLPIAQGACSVRPTVSVLFAMIGCLLHGALTVGGYAFLCSFVLCGLLSFAGFLLQVFGRGRALDPVFAVLFGAAYACGFWGQYPVDIDAWSEVAAAPLLLSAWSLVFAELTASAGPVPRGGAVALPTLALGLLVAGALYFYPEGTLYHLLILAAVSVAAGSPRLPRLRVVAAALVLAACVAALFWTGTIGTLIAQANVATTAHVSWWRYFDSYLFGQDPNLLHALKHSKAAVQTLPHFVRLLFRLASVVTWIAGILGVYFLTPANYGELTTLDIARVVLLVLVVVGVVRAVGTGWRSGHRGYRLLLAAAGFGLLGAVLLLLKGQSWSAGKALSYAAPFFCLAILAPAMIEDKPGKAIWLRSVPWLLAQACFAGMTLIGLGNPDGIRLPAPYPEIQDVALKSEINWDVADRLRRVRDCRRVEIVAANPFFRQFASIALYDSGKPYFFTQPVNSYYYVGRTIGTMSGEPESPDCTLAQRGRSGSP